MNAIPRIGAEASASVSVSGTEGSAPPCAPAASRTAMKLKAVLKSGFPEPTVREEMLSRLTRSGERKTGVDGRGGVAASERKTYSVR